MGNGNSRREDVYVEQLHGGHDRWQEWVLLGGKAGVLPMDLHRHQVADAFHPTWLKLILNPPSATAAKVINSPGSTSEGGNFPNNNRKFSRNFSLFPDIAL